MSIKERNLSQNLHGTIFPERKPVPFGRVSGGRRYPFCLQLLSAHKAQHDRHPYPRTTPLSFTLFWLYGVVWGFSIYTSCLRAFILAISSTSNALPPDIGTIHFFTYRPLPTATVSERLSLNARDRSTAPPHLLSCPISFFRGHHQLPEPVTVYCVSFHPLSSPTS